MQVSDRNFFRQYAIDPSMEFDFEELYDTDLLRDFPLDDEKNLFDRENIFNVKASILDDDFLFDI